jgi:hypothetical protein
MVAVASEKQQELTQALVDGIAAFSTPVCAVQPSGRATLIMSHPSFSYELRDSPCLRFSLPLTCNTRMST